MDNINRVTLILFMDKRFFSIFNLTEEQAIDLLDTPQAEISEDDSRYIAASHLINFNTDRSIEALIRAVKQDDPALENRIVRRKSIESLGRLNATQAIPTIRECLQDEDCYTVENAVWAIGEIGTQDPAILAEITALLDKPKQTYRVIIHTLASADYQPAVESIRRFVNDSDAPTASAAIAAICRLTRDFTDMEKVVAMLQHPAVLGRRLSIQDLIDAKYYPAIPEIANCPVSLVFRLRGIRMLAEAGIAEGAIDFATVRPHLEKSLIDRPSDLKLVHTYAQTPPLASLIEQLYDTDFGKCYLATQTILDRYAEAAPAALFQTYADEAHNDYGAHFHVIKLFGWLKHQPAYDLLLEGLHNTQPQFQKSRAAAAIALGELGNPACIPYLKASLETKIWDLKYAALLTLEKFGDTSGRKIAAADDDWLVRAKAEDLIAASS
jgi:bilin biosynthesis protein